MTGSVRILGAAVAIAAAAAACRQGGRAGNHPLIAPVPVTYAAGTAAWPPAVSTSVIGRGVAPARAVPASVAGAIRWPAIAVDRVWAVPEDAEARAVVAGTVGDRPAVEVIGVDDGWLRWRDLTVCQAPVVHVTAEVIVCGSAIGMVGLEVGTGAERWRHPLQFVGAEGDLIVAVTPGEVDSGRFTVIAAPQGTVVVETAPPQGVLASDVRRACTSGGGLELWSWTAGGALSRFTVDQAGTPSPATSMNLPAPPARIEACLTPALVELPIGGSIERQLFAVSREPFAPIAEPIIERGFWRRPDGTVGVATAAGIEIRDPSLALLRTASDALVGRELASRGERRLVRAAGGLPVLLEHDQPIAYLSAPAHADSAVLGDRHVLGGGWQAPARSFADRIQRFLLPGSGAGHRFRVGSGAGHRFRVPAIATVEPAWAEVTSLDLPLEEAADGAAIELSGVGMHDVGIVVVDPDDPAIVYAVPLERRPDRTHGAGIAALDLGGRRWIWHAPEGCGPGTPVALGVAREVIVCGSRGSAVGSGAVRAVDRATGEVRWTWQGATVDAVTAGGGLVVITVGRRALIVDARDGSAIGEVDADDGFVPRLVPLAIRGTDVVIVAERGALVARLPRIGMLPLWSAEIRGLVVGMAPAGDRLTVELAGGELYFVDPATGAAVAAAGWSRRWRTLLGSDLALAEPSLPAGDEWRLAGYGNDGAPRFAIGLAVEPPWLVGVRGGDPGAPVTLAYGPAARAAAVVDPQTGVVRRRVTLPERSVPGVVFATVVDGIPVAGAVLARPLAVVLF